MAQEFIPGYTSPKGSIIRGFDRNIVIAEGTSVPADGSIGYAPGCTFFKRAGAADALRYINNGSATSSAFIAELSSLSLGGLLATAAEINRIAKPSTRIVTAGATLTVTQALHDGKTIAMPAVCAITLPAATGSGSRFRFFQQIAATAVTITATGAHLFGVAWALSDNSAAVLGYEAAGSTVVTFDGSTQGGRKGHIVEIEDIATSVMSVRSMGAATSTEATPFS